MSSDLSGSFWNAVTKDEVDEYEQIVALLESDLMLDGYPPFSHPLDQREQWDHLEMLRLTNDDLFWLSASAQQAWARLQPRYGLSGKAQAAAISRNARQF